MSHLLNPYNVGGIAGNALGLGFFGRRDILDFVDEQLASVKRPPILLQGQRRIGKSSVLRQIPRVLGAATRCALVDLQGKARLPLDEMLYVLAREVALACQLPRPDPDDLDEARFDAWLDAAVQGIGGARNLVLLFDEFDVVDSNEQGAEGGHFVPWLSSFTERHGDIGCVMVVGRKASDLSEQINGALLRNAVHRRIGRLERDEVVDLVQQLAGDAARFDAAALDAIWHQAAGHPYCTQVLCSEVWNRAVSRADQLPARVTAEQVQAAVLPAIEAGTLGMNWIYDGISVPSHRFFLGAMAELAADHPEQPQTMAAIEQHLYRRGTAVEPTDLRQAPVKLANWDVIDSSPAGHAFCVPMIGLWIRRNRPLADLAAQTQLVSPRAHRYFEMAVANLQREAWDEAVADLQLALQANPGMVDAHLGLAGALRARNHAGDLAAAIESYERALDLAPDLPRKAMLEAMAQGIDENGGVVAEQLRLFKRIEKLDESGEFVGRARRSLDQFAARRVQSLKTVEGAAELFDAADNPAGKTKALGRQRYKQRLNNTLRWSLLCGIGLALVPFDTIAIGGWQISEALSTWLRAALLSLGIGVAFASSEAENGYDRARLSLLPIAALAAGLLVQWIFAQLVATGIAAFVAATIAGVWADNSPPIPDELKPRQTPSDGKPPLAGLAQRTAAWLSGYAQSATSPKRKEEP